MAEAKQKDGQKKPEAGPSLSDLFKSRETIDKKLEAGKDERELSVLLARYPSLKEKHPELKAVAEKIAGLSGKSDPKEPQEPKEPADPKEPKGK